MSDYLHYIREWAMIGFMGPFYWLLLVVGPLFMLFPFVKSSRKWEHLSMFLMLCSMASYMFVCIGTGIYLGKRQGFGGWGILLGFAFFIATGFAIAYVQRAIDTARRRRVNAASGTRPPHQPQ
jgi:hypothetical protein